MLYWRGTHIGGTSAPRNDPMAKMDMHIECDTGHWTLDIGYWTLDTGHSTIDHCVENNTWTTDQRELPAPEA